MVIKWNSVIQPVHFVQNSCEFWQTGLHWIFCKIELAQYVTLEKCLETPIRIEHYSQDADWSGSQGPYHSPLVWSTSAHTLFPGTVQGAGLDLQSPIWFGTNIPEQLPTPLKICPTTMVIFGSSASGAPALWGNKPGKTTRVLEHIP